MALVGKEKIVHLIVNTALALSVATGCTQKAEAKPPILTGNERTTLPSREVDCEDLGKLNITPPSSEKSINGFKVRVYAVDPRNMLITASARAVVMNSQEVEVNFSPVPGSQVEMDFTNENSSLAFSGRIILGQDVAPSPWEQSTKKPETDGCIVASVSVVNSKINPALTGIYSLPGKRGTAG